MIRKMHARALAESATMTIKVRECNSHSPDDENYRATRGCSDRKKKLGAGDVYSVIDDGVMMTRLQIGRCLLSRIFPYTLHLFSSVTGRRRSMMNDDDGMNESMTVSLVINLLCRI